ncbi:hypothetical protein NOVOSPHI9U_200003 [Novosphingobium sp. 9U]|nr:hypothetical protein NOVOSPHI9U_200003 [Novosphingobium sp. 9U]
MHAYLLRISARIVFGELRKETNERTKRGFLLQQIEVLDNDVWSSPSYQRPMMAPD